MKNKFIDVIQIPFKIALILLMTFFIYKGLNSVFINQNIIDENTGSKYGDSFHSLPKDSMDVIVLGSSHAQYSFNPTFFYKQTGLYSYNLGTMCQPLEVSYEMLKEALKTQSPKLVVLEVFTSMPMREMCEADSCYITAAYQMTGEERNNVLNYLPEEKRNEYINEFMNNHNNWKDININDLLNFTDGDGKEISPDFGYVFNYTYDPEFTKWYRPALNEGTEQVELDELDLLSLNSIYELCKEKGIELLLYKTPIDSLDKLNQSHLDKVKEWANEKENNFISFQELTKELKFYMNIHSDSYHCFISGANIITNYLSKYIKNTYEFNHVANEELDEKYLENNDWYIRELLDTDMDPNNYLRALKGDPGTIIINFEKSSLKDNEKEIFKDFGLVEGFEENDNYYVIIDNGEVVIQTTDIINDYLVGEKHISINNEYIDVNGEHYNHDTYITLVFIGKDDSITIKNISKTASNKLWDAGKYEYYK